MEAIQGNSLDATKARMLGTDASQDANRMFPSKRRLMGGVRWPHQQDPKEVRPAGIVKQSPEMCVARQRVSFVPVRSPSRPNILKPSMSQKFNRSWSTTSTAAPTMTPSSSEVELAAGSEFSVSTGAYTPPPSDSTPGRPASSQRGAMRQLRWR
jgi:hypothetical protein